MFKSRFEKLQIKIAGQQARVDVWKNVSHQNYATVLAMQEDCAKLAELKEEINQIWRTK